MAVPSPGSPRYDPELRPIPDMEKPAHFAEVVRDFLWWL